MDLTVLHRSTMLVATLVLTAGIAAAQQQPEPLPRVTSPAPAATPQGISAEEIRAEMRPSHATAYTVGGVLIGGLVGVLVGGRIGYSIAYARDTRSGCEDCGLGGLLVGALVGGGAGLIGGGILGARAGERADRDAAIQRILARRTAADTVRR